jgi:hypothetical protein
MISRAQLQGSGSDNLPNINTQPTLGVPGTATLATAEGLVPHPLREIPAIVLGSQRGFPLATVTAGAALVFRPANSTVTKASMTVTSGTADYGFVALSLSEYCHLIGKKLAAPIDVELSDTPDDFAHHLNSKPVIVLGVQLHGTTEDGAVLVFDPANSTHTKMRLSLTTPAGQATFRVLPLTQTAYNALVGRALNGPISVSDLTTTPQNIQHHMPMRPLIVLGCQIAGDVDDGSELVYNRPGSTDSLMALRATSGDADWRVLPIAGHRGSTQ